MTAACQNGGSRWDHHPLSTLYRLVRLHSETLWVYRRKSCGCSENCFVLVDLVAITVPFTMFDGACGRRFLDLACRRPTALALCRVTESVSVTVSRYCVSQCRECMPLHYTTTLSTVQYNNPAVQGGRPSDWHTHNWWGVHCSYDQWPLLYSIGVSPKKGAFCQLVIISKHFS